MKLSDIAADCIDAELEKEAFATNMQDVLLTGESFWLIVAYLQHVASLNLPPKHSDLAGGMIDVSKSADQILDRVIGKSNNKR